MDAAFPRSLPDASTPLIVVRAAMDNAHPELPEIAIRVDRQKLARRRWRGRADDGADFGFELEVPLAHGDIVWATPTGRYAIRQAAEPLLEISIAVPPEQAALIGWAVGNMHAVIEVGQTRLRVPDDPGLRQTLDRIGIAFRAVTAVFQAHRLAGVVGHSHGPGAGPEAHPYIQANRLGH